jgi:membrane protease subunit HflK
MGWNEPGNGKDPWSRQSPGGKPPDLEDMLRRLRNRLGGGKPGNEASLSALAIIGAVVVIWLLSGIYIVKSAERGVVLRFGKHVATAAEGLNWHLPYPIERVEKIDIQQVRPHNDHAIMLTQDENIVDVALTVQYRISNAENYLFSVRNPETTLHEATRSAVREVVGRSKVDFVLKEGREEVARQTQEILQKLLDSYKAGIQISSLSLQEAHAPEAVQPAFDDVQKAVEDEARKKNEAEAYANLILPQARGEAARQAAEAEAYRTRVVERAKGEADRFIALAAEYERAPQVTRKRLYLDAMESVMSNTSKIVVDTSKGGNQLLYLPVDQLMRQQTGGQGEAAPSPAANAAPARPSAGSSSGDDYRGRGR